MAEDKKRKYPHLGTGTVAMRGGTMPSAGALKTASRPAGANAQVPMPSAESIPGGVRGAETGRLASEAMAKGGVSSGLGVIARRAPGDIASATGQFIKRGVIDPTNRLLGVPINAGANLVRTAVTGEVVPEAERKNIVNTEPVQSLPKLQPDDVLLPGENTFQPKQAVQQEPLKADEGWIKDSQTGEMISLRGGKTAWTKDGVPIDKPVRAPGEMLGARQDKRSSLDVSFDPSVSLGARKAFMAQPVAPTAQMARYEAYQNTPRGQFFGARPIKNETPQPQTIGEMIVDRQRMGREKVEAGIRQEDERNMTNVRGQDLVSAAARERNAIDAINVTGENALRGAQTKGAELDLAGKQQLNDLQDRLIASKDPVERNILKSQILAMQGKDTKATVTTRKTTDPITGITTEVPYAVDPDNPGGAVEIGGEGAMSEIGIINGNPKYKAAFDAATPEKQQEMIAKIRERLAQMAI